jgi:hypothetical protein
MNSIKVNTRYVIEVDKSLLLKILEKDKINSYKINGLSLAESLEKDTCAYNVQYDGFFGPYIWFTLDDADDTSMSHKNVYYSIMEYARTK